MDLTGYLGLWWTAASAVAAVVGLRRLHRLTSVHPSPLLGLPFESGWPPHQHALSRFHTRWYPMTVLFLAFDVEMLFMYPWSLVVAEVGSEAVVEMFAFLGLLLLAVVWARREGALRWV